MSTTDGIASLHPQDRLLIIEALAYWASGHGSVERPAGVVDARRHRAIELAEFLLEVEDLDAGFRDAIDPEWDGSDDRSSLVAVRSELGEYDSVDA